MSRVLVQTPAKLNLGLAVLGRRPDGYHDLITIMQTVGLFDRLTFTRGAGLHLTAADPALETPDNLILAALRALRARASATAGALVQLEKGIPVAAGLGGASSDAAAALLGADRLWESRLDAATMHALAAGIGSDVPFFLTGGAALVGGRGERVEPLPPALGIWFVVAVPLLPDPIPRKTATLYAALTSRDLGDGAAVRAQAQRLRAGLPPDPELLGNSFRRPLHALRPALTEIEAAFFRAGAAWVAISGAGPAHYTATPDPRAAAALKAALDDDLGRRAVTLICQAIAGPPRVNVRP